MKKSLIALLLYRICFVENIVANAEVDTYGHPIFPPVKNINYFPLS